MVVVDAAAALGEAICDGETGNGNGFTRTDVKHAAGGVAIHRKVRRAEAADGDTLIHRQFAAGQCDRLSIKRRIEIDRVAIISVGQRLAQRARAGIVRIRHGEGARRHAAIAEAGIHPVFLDEELPPVEDDIVLGAVARDRSRAILTVALVAFSLPW